MEANGGRLRERVETHGRELERVRDRLHTHGTFITELRGEVDDLNEWRQGVNRVLIGLLIGVPLGAFPVLLALLVGGGGG